MHSRKRPAFARDHQRHSRSVENRSRATRPAPRALPDCGARRSNSPQVFSRRRNKRGFSFTWKFPPGRFLSRRPILGGGWNKVLGNLVSNAIKFTSEGSVTLSVSSEITPNEEIFLKFVVRDTGIGIPQKDLDRLFQPFIQLDSSIARKYGGSGLGLASPRPSVHEWAAICSSKAARAWAPLFTATVRVSRTRRNARQPQGALPRCSQTGRASEC